MGDSSRYYKVDKVIDDIYRISNSFVGMTLVVGKEHALLFDTGYGFTDYTPVIRGITDLPLYIVNSHCHYDHAGGNYLFQGPVYVNEKELPVFEVHSSSDFRKHAIDTHRKVQKILFWAKSVPKDVDKETYASKTFDNFAFIKEGDQFDLGGIKLEVVELPGHTAGSIGLFCAKKRVLLVGDAMNPNTWLYLPESTDLSVYINTLKKAKRMDFDQMILSHQKKLVPKSAIDEYIAVAENPDFANGKIQKEDIYAPGVESRRCFQKGIRSTKKKPSIVISKDKIDIDG